MKLATLAFYSARTQLNFRRYTDIHPETFMKPATLLLQLAAAALLGASGSQLATSLQMNWRTEAALAGFAIAIVLFALVPLRALRDRVVLLEHALAERSIKESSSPTAV